MNRKIIGGMYVYNGILPSIKKKSVLRFVTTWNLDNNMLSEISQTNIVLYHLHLESKTKNKQTKIIITRSRMVVTIGCGCGEKEDLKKKKKKKVEW